MNLSNEDRAALARRGKTEGQLERELKMLSEGFPMLRVEAPATPGHGISLLTPTIEASSIAMWEEFLAAGATVVKFVPASGAASRMFKNLFAFLNGEADKPADDFMRLFFDRIEDFAFFRWLNLVCLKNHGKSVGTLISENRYKDVVESLLSKTGMNYGGLPKALLQFHKSFGFTRTPMEEHLLEGAATVAGRDGKVRVHFTMSDDHMPLAKMKVEECAGFLSHECGKVFDVSFSTQKHSTDTVAALPDGTPYREKGELFFRPGGHGALIENLNEIDADVIFVKNIDNILPDSRRASTVHYKKVLGGILVSLRQTIDKYCRRLQEQEVATSELDEMLKFLRAVLCVTNDSADTMTIEEKKNYLFGKFNRPVRVCGMVRNEGEPGGGPYLAYNSDGTISPQILESVQLDTDKPEVKEMMAKATHFNPVDLVCSIRDYKGCKFDLRKYVDPTTGFISHKSREGVDILALELPGLWNGAMSDWNTVFVEVPAETFNPVKTVNDLLRPAHQPEPSAPCQG